MIYGKTDKSHSIDIVQSSRQTFWRPQLYELRYLLLYRKSKIQTSIQVEKLIFVYRFIFESSFFGNLRCLAREFPSEYRIKF